MAGTVIRGTVVDAGGAAVALAAIYVISGPEAHRDIAQLSGSDGSFALSVNTAGVYVIGARSDSAGEGRASVTASGGEAQVRIPLPGRV